MGSARRGHQVVSSRYQCSTKLTSTHWKTQKAGRKEPLGSHDAGNLPSGERLRHGPRHRLLDSAVDDDPSSRAKPGIGGAAPARCPVGPGTEGTAVFLERIQTAVPFVLN